MAKNEYFICWRTKLYIKKLFLGIGAGRKLLNAIPAYTKHGFHTGIHFNSSSLFQSFAFTWNFCLRLLATRAPRVRCTFSRCGAKSLEAQKFSSFIHVLLFVYYLPLAWCVMNILMKVLEVQNC